jgi:hypothetical protein
MFIHHPRHHWRNRLKIVAIALLGMLAVNWWAREDSKYSRSAKGLVCEPRGKAGSDCRPLAAREANVGATCESFGRGGRICSGPLE